MSARHEEWLAKAGDDLNFAELGFREKFYSHVCFLSQQAIEKAFKGTLVFLRRAYPKSHSLRELARLLPELKLEDHYEQLIVIDGYYVPIRYPDAAPGMKAGGPPNEVEARAALDAAMAIMGLVENFTKNA